ncbi:MAG: hypothetical protein VX498_14465 [Myxococcota bacterium]|nr:hypothetical protein [Myxococcota bacterium]
MLAAVCSTATGDILPGGALSSDCYRQHASMRVTPSPVCILLVSALLACGPTGAEPPPAPVPDGNPDYQELLDIQASPEVVAPGAPIEINVTGAAIEGAHAVLQLDTMTTTLDLELTADGLQAAVTLPAPQTLGDHLIEVQGVAPNRDLVGYALVTVSNLPPCPDGQALERGSCVVRASGSPLEPLVLGPVNIPDDLEPGEGGSRSMMHPQALAALSSTVLLGCFSDSIAIVDSMDFEAMQGGSVPGGPTPAERIPVLETILAEVTTEGCQSLTLDLDRRIAVLASRGETGRPGGLSSWRIPDLDGELHAPVFLADLEDDDGFEDALFVNGLLYASLKPHSLAAFEVDDDGQFSLLYSESIDGLGSSWALASEPGRLYLGDGGGFVFDEERHEDDRGREHAQAGGHVFLFDLSLPSAPQLTGWVGTQGPAKGLVPLGDGVLAVGSGSSGLELIDVADPSNPVQLDHFETPGVAKTLAAQNGYLLLADWSTLRLYDIDDPRHPRFLGASNLNRPGSSFPGLLSAQYVVLDDDRFWVGEFNNIVGGRIRMGLTGPRLNLGRNAVSLPLPSEGQAAVAPVSFDNGGRGAMVVRLESGSEKLGYGGVLQRVLAPGVSDRLLPLVTPVADSTESTLPLESNGVVESDREVPILFHEEHYGAGDLAPTFRLPVTNLCDDEGCSTDTSCFDSRDASERGVPLLIAFFSSW